MYKILSQSLQKKKKKSELVKIWKINRNKIKIMKYEVFQIVLDS